VENFKKSPHSRRTRIDDVLKTYHSKRFRDPTQELMSDAEVVFAGILSARHFAGNLRKDLAYVLEKRYVLKTLSEGRFLRRLRLFPLRFGPFYNAFWLMLRRDVNLMSTS